MPYIRKTTRITKYTKRKSRKPSSFRKKTYKRKSYNRSKPKKQPFSHYERTSLKYMFNNDLATNSSVNSAGNEYAFILNAINQPFNNQAVADFLPQGFDQYAPVFNKYKVYAAKINFEMYPNTTGKQITLVLQLNNSANFTNIIQGKTAQSQTGFQNTWTYTIPTDKKFKFTKYVPIHAIEAITRNQFDSDLSYYDGVPNSSIAALTANIPLKRVTFKAALINETDSTAVSIPMEINIQYYTTFYDRKRLSQSNSSV